MWRRWQHHWHGSAALPGLKIFLATIRMVRLIIFDVPRATGLMVAAMQTALFPFSFLILTS
jgi:hypothetical protein